MSSLRTALAQVNGSAESIQAAANAMMKQYSTADVAVSEWRNALLPPTSSRLALVYVANEVLQTSKRNRGNQYLEAFGAVLGPSLEFVCQKDPSLTEKIRRTVKIWGDRQVYSVRFVGALLQGLEPYRGRASNTSSTTHRPPNTDDDDDDGATFSPEAAVSEANDTPAAEEETDIMDILEEGPLSEDDDDDDASLMGGENDQRLNVSIDLDTAPTTTRKAKRRRSSVTRSKRSSVSVLSTSGLVEVWTKVEAQQQTVQQAQRSLRLLQEQLDAAPSADSLIGEELQQAYQQVQKSLQSIQTQRRNLYSAANEQHGLELEAKRYLQWLETLLDQDTADLALCDRMEQELVAWSELHIPLKKARDIRVALEDKAKLAAEEAERQRKEEEEAEAFRQAALGRNDAPQSAADVWNPATQEYQSQHNLDESWRD